MESIQKFRSIIPAERAAKIFRELVRKQDLGEITSEAQLREELEKAITSIAARGRVAIEIPIPEGKVIESNKTKDFFDSLKLDIDIIFKEVDSTEEILDRISRILSAQVQVLKFAVGQLKAESIQKQIRIKPGAGFTTILRDSFDRGYSNLAGRAEVPFDIFKDVRSAIDIEKAEAVPIKADARIEGIGKKLILPASEERLIGFKNIFFTNSTSANQLDIDNIYPIENAIDGEDDTFWSYTVGRTYPILGSGTVTTKQVLGISGVPPTIDTTSREDTRPADYYFAVVGISGSDPVLQSLPTQESFVGPICDYDLGNRCKWGYADLYSQNCINANCSRYTVTSQHVLSGSFDLEDGFGHDTGIDLSFAEPSGLQVGQTWRVSTRASGTVGATVGLELIVQEPSYINWFEIDPIIDNPFTITRIEYSKPAQSSRNLISDEIIDVRDKVRIDFPKIEAEKIYLTINQQSYRTINIKKNLKAGAIVELDKLKNLTYEPVTADTSAVQMPVLLDDYLTDPLARDLIVQDSSNTEKIEGVLYQVGIFEINCGLAQYSENAIAVSKDHRVETPTMFGLQANLEDPINIDISGADSGTLEFSVIKLNYDSLGSLINIQDFPVPYFVSGYVVERAFVDNESAALLRFATDSISGIQDLTQNRMLTSSDYEVSTTSETVPRSTVTFNRADIGANNIMLVTYIPKFGVFLDSDKTLTLEDNRSHELSTSNVESVVVSEAKIANREIKFADIHTRIILRRNNSDTFTTPKLRDYQLLVNESDENRFKI